MSIVQGTLPVGSLDQAITLNVQSSGGSHFETVTNTTPYLHRASPQDVASSMKLKKVVGGTIAWNQKFPTKTLNYTGTGYTLTSANDGVWIITVTSVATQSASINHTNIAGSVFTANHVHLLLGDDSTNGIDINMKGYPHRMSGLFKPTSPTYSNISVTFTDLPVGTYKLYPQVFDLTQMFGSTIADYIYSLEQAHAGDGVAWFKALFGEDYYPYNSGELLSVKTSARKTYNADNVEIGSYALDGNLTLRGIPKLDSNNELYYDGDTYASDGSVTRRYGVYKFTGNETQYVQQTNRVAINTRQQMASTSAVCSHFAGVSTAAIRYAYIPTTLTADDLKTFMRNNDVYLVYELATPTTESADAYTQSQRVGATEEFVDARSVEMPVGNVSEYKRLIQENEP